MLLAIALYMPRDMRKLQRMSLRVRCALALLMLAATGIVLSAATPTVASAEGQPLAANVERLCEALEYLGAPLPPETRTALARAGQARDAQKLQELLDPRVLLVVHLNPEARVKVGRGPAPAGLQQAGYTPVLVKVVNESGGTQRLRIGSPQAGPVYAHQPDGVSPSSWQAER